MKINTQAIVNRIYKAKNDEEISSIIMEVFHLGQISATRDQVIPSELSEEINLKQNGARLRFGSRWVRVEEGRYEKHMGPYSAVLTFEKQGYKKAHHIFLFTNIAGKMVRKRLAEGYRRDLVKRANAVLYKLCDGNINKIKHL